MKKALVLLCPIFLIGFVLNGCAQSKEPVSSAVQSSSASEDQNITLEKDKISKDVVFRRTSAADGKIVLTSGQIERIEMKPSQTSDNPRVFDITFFLTEESRKQFAADSQEIAEAGEKMSIWGKNGKIASAEFMDPISDGIFVLNGSYSLEEAKQHMESFSSDS